MANKCPAARSRQLAAVENQLQLEVEGNNTNKKSRHGPAEADRHVRSLARAYIAGRSRRALGAVQGMRANSTIDDPSNWLHLWQQLVLPVVSYGGELWGAQHQHLTQPSYFSDNPGEEVHLDLLHWYRGAGWPRRTHASSCRLPHGCWCCSTGCSNRCRCGTNSNLCGERADVAERQQRLLSHSTCLSPPPPGYPTSRHPAALAAALQPQLCVSQHGCHHRCQRGDPLQLHTAQQHMPIA